MAFSAWGNNQFNNAAVLNADDLNTGVPALAPVHSVSGKTGAVTLAHGDITDLNAMNGGPGLVYLNAANNPSVQLAYLFPPFVIKNAASGDAFSVNIPHAVVVQGYYQGLIVGGGSTTFGIKQDGSDVLNACTGSSTANLNSTSATKTFFSNFFWNSAAGSTYTITLNAITGTITTAFIQLIGNWNA